MASLEDIAEKLAEDTLKAMKFLDDDRFFMEVAKELAASSTTLEEAFLTAIRVRLADRRARRFIKARLEGKPKDTNG